MSNSTSSIPGPAEPVSANSSGSSPSTREIVLGIFALIFGLSALTVAILQFHQGRTKHLAREHYASGQPDNYGLQDVDHHRHLFPTARLVVNIAAYDVVVASVAITAVRPWDTAAHHRRSLPVLTSFVQRSPQTPTKLLGDQCAIETASVAFDYWNTRVNASRLVSKSIPPVTFGTYNIYLSDLHAIHTLAMNNTVVPAAPAPIDSTPPPFEIIIGLLALVLALAAVVVGVAQYLQTRAAKRRNSDTESGVEMPIVPSHRSDTDSVRSVLSIDTGATIAVNLSGP
ncbi:hypothetical protein Q7P36_005434 [Cladosporium allicinum]